MEKPSYEALYFHHIVSEDYLTRFSAAIAEFIWNG